MVDAADIVRGVVERYFVVLRSRYEQGWARCLREGGDCSIFDGFPWPRLRRGSYPHMRTPNLKPVLAWDFLNGVLEVNIDDGCLIMDYICNVAPVTRRNGQSSYLITSGLFRAGLQDPGCFGRLRGVIDYVAGKQLAGFRWCVMGL